MSIPATVTQMNICVFCGSSEGRDERYMALADATGQTIHRHGYGLVYGGGGAGLMGQTARSVHEAGGYVLGVIPEFLMNAERVYRDVETVVVPDMHTRKMKMYEASSAFIILPGGIGTLEEAVEMICWMRLQLHQKPIVFLSDNGYWERLNDLINFTIEERFSPDWIMDDIKFESDPNAAMAWIQTTLDGPARAMKPVTSISKA